jgi:hypothetical protein
MLFIIAPNPIIPSFITIKYFDEESTTSNKNRIPHILLYIARRDHPLFPSARDPEGTGREWIFHCWQGPGLHTTVPEQELHSFDLELTVRRKSHVFMSDIVGHNMTHYLSLGIPLCS